MSEPVKEIARRRPVWKALSDLFLDTELQDYTFRYIARILAESGYDDDTLHYILYGEVFPVCMPSLLSLTGEWAGFSLEWVEERILADLGDPLCPPLTFSHELKNSLPFLELIEPDWQKVLPLLPEARHISGNPYRPYRAPAHWPRTVVQLAEALHNGQDCGFALHDALLEAGHTELAEHFRQEQSHPKGCWIVDMILGNK
jgi:hypothetical protein